MTASSVHAATLARRKLASKAFRLLCAGLTWLVVVLLGVLLLHIAWEGIGRLSLQFLTSPPSRFAERAGVESALWGTVWLMGLTAMFAIPVGVAAAVYLEEYPMKGGLRRLIEINIANLAGVPSIVYGILGLAIFVRWMSLGSSILAGALTMTLLILPVIITAAREALRAVPPSLRQAAFALGGTRWQTIWHHVLPSAVPGILTGIILAMSRAIGETAPLIMIGAVAYIHFVPESPMDPFTALPIQIFDWASMHQTGFQELAASAIIVLLAVLLMMNSVAFWIRQRSGRERT